jgi:hypothetical protein
MRCSSELHENKEATRHGHENSGRDEEQKLPGGIGFTTIFEKAFLVDLVSLRDPASRPGCTPSCTEKPEGGPEISISSCSSAPAS